MFCRHFATPLVFSR